MSSAGDAASRNCTPRRRCVEGFRKTDAIALEIVVPPAGAVITTVARQVVRDGDVPTVGAVPVPRLLARATAVSKSCLLAAVVVSQTRIRAHVSSGGGSRRRGRNCTRKPCRCRASRRRPVDRVPTQKDSAPARPVLTVAWPRRSGNAQRLRPYVERSTALRPCDPGRPLTEARVAVNSCGSATPSGPRHRRPRGPRHALELRIEDRIRVSVLFTTARGWVPSVAPTDHRRP